MTEDKISTTYNFFTTLEKDEDDKFESIILTKSIFTNTFLCPKCEKLVKWFLLESHDSFKYVATCCDLDFEAVPNLYTVNGKEREG